MSGYILFYTTQAAFLCEKILKSNNILVKLTPTPREFSSDCGISAYFWKTPITKVSQILNQNKVEFKIISFKDETLER